MFSRPIQSLAPVGGKALRLDFRVLILFWATILFPLSPAQADNPYSSILQRNVFGLKPPPSVAKDPPHAPSPKVRLTGITTILKGKRALLKVEYPAKPGQRPKEESFILKEGERSGPIEVLEIDEKIDRVKLDNSGTITNITFENTIAKPAPSPPVALPRLRGLSPRPTYR